MSQNIFFHKNFSQAPCLSHPTIHNIILLKLVHCTNFMDKDETKRGREGGNGALTNVSSQHLQQRRGKRGSFSLPFSFGRPILIESLLRRERAHAYCFQQACRDRIVANRWCLYVDRFFQGSFIAYLTLQQRTLSKENRARMTPNVNKSIGTILQPF